MHYIDVQSDFLTIAKTILFLYQHILNKIIKTPELKSESVQ